MSTLCDIAFEITLTHVMQDVFADWLLKQVAEGENGKQRRKELKTAFNSRRLGPDTLPCKVMTVQKKGCFSCPLGKIFGRRFVWRVLTGLQHRWQYCAVRVETRYRTLP